MYPLRDELDSGEVVVEFIVSSRLHEHKIPEGREMISLLFQCLFMVLVLSASEAPERYLFGKFCAQPKTGTTLHGINENLGFVKGYERRDQNGKVVFRITESISDELTYNDRNGDGKFDEITLKKRYIGYLRLPDSEFDKHFSDDWRNGVEVHLNDDDYDGYFELKTLAKFDKTGRVITLMTFFDKIGNGKYELQETEQFRIDPTTLAENLLDFAGECIRSKFVIPLCLFAPD